MPDIVIKLPNYPIWASFFKIFLNNVVYNVFLHFLLTLCSLGFGLPGVKLKLEHAPV